MHAGNRGLQAACYPVRLLCCPVLFLPSQGLIIAPPGLNSLLWGGGLPVSDHSQDMTILADVWLALCQESLCKPQLHCLFGGFRQHLRCPSLALFQGEGDTILIETPFYGISNFLSSELMCAALCLPSTLFFQGRGGRGILDKQINLVEFTNMALVCFIL